MKGAVFEPNIIKAMADAFDATCNSLQLSQCPQIVKEIIAKRIIELAQGGEYDSKKLHAAALKAFNLLPDV